MLTWLWQQRAGHVAMIVYGLLILAASLLVARVMRGLARRQF